MTAFCPTCRQVIQAPAAPLGIPIPRNVPEDRRQSFREFMGLYQSVCIHLREFHRSLIEDLEAQLSTQLVALLANLSSLRLMGMVQATDPEFASWFTMIREETWETIRLVIQVHGLEERKDGNQCNLCRKTIGCT